MLDIINIEKEPNEVNINFSRAKIEQSHKDVTCFFKKSQKACRRSDNWNWKISGEI